MNIAPKKRRSSGKSLLVSALFCIHGIAQAMSVECGALEEGVAIVAFTSKAERQEVEVLVPKLHEGATLVGLSVVYGPSQELIAPLELWPADAGDLSAHFEVSLQHKTFVIRADFSRGACRLYSLTPVAAGQN